MGSLSEAPTTLPRPATSSRRQGEADQAIFDLVDRGLRDQMGESLWRRLQIGDPSTATKDEVISLMYCPNTEIQ